jgi:hypothetical protein
MNDGGSSSGRTTDSDSVYLGSNPSPPAKTQKARHPAGLSRFGGGTRMPGGPEGPKRATGARSNPSPPATASSQVVRSAPVPATASSQVIRSAPVARLRRSYDARRLYSNRVGFPRIPTNKTPAPAPDSPRRNARHVGFAHTTSMPSSDPISNTSAGRLANSPTVTIPAN